MTSSPRRSAHADRTAVANSPSWKVLGTVAGIATYIALFYAFDARRRLILSQLLVPEELVSSWVDGDWSRFGLFDHVPVIAGATLIYLVSALTGWLVLNLLRVTQAFDVWEQLVISIAVGLNIWSLLTLAIGLAGGLRDRVWFGGLAVVFVVLAAWRLVVDRPNLRSTKTADSVDTGPDQLETCTRFGQWALLLSLPLTIVIILGGTLPPTHFDVREYHLQVPKEWYQQGRVTFLPHNVYGNMPLGAEMHSVLGMLLSFGRDDWWWGSLVGKTVIAAMGPLGAAGVFILGRRFIAADAGAWGAFAYLSTPWIAHVSMTGLIDGAVAFYVVAAIAVALRVILPIGPDHSRSPAHRGSLLAVAGFLAGGAVSCKYPALLFLVAPLGILVTLLPQRRMDWKAAVIFSCSVVAGCGLWFGKNWVLTGNPTYPLLYSVFDGQTWNEEKNARWTRAHGPPHDAEGNQFTWSQLGDSVALLAIRSDHHGPGLIPLAAAAFWTWRSKRHRQLLLQCLAIIGMGVVSWWLLTHRVDRFLVPILPLVAVAAGIGATWSGQASWRRAIAWLGGFCFLLSFLQLASPFGADNRFLVALRDLKEDLPRSDDQPFTRMNDGHRWLNHNVPLGYRALLVGEAQVFDLEIPILYNTCFDDCILETLLRDRSRDERLRILQEMQISHIFVSWYELQRYRQPGNYGYSDFPTRELFYEELVREQQLLKPLSVGKSRDYYEIFEVIGAGNSPDPRRDRSL